MPWPSETRVYYCRQCRGKFYARAADDFWCSSTCKQDWRVWQHLREGPLSVRELYLKMHVERGEILKSLDALVADGLVERDDSSRQTTRWKAVGIR